MSIVLIIIASFIAFLISLVIFVKREDDKERDILKNGIKTTGTLKKVSRKGKSVSKNRMIISYEAIYEYVVDNHIYSVKSIFEIGMEDFHTQIPEQITICYNKNKPKEGYISFESTEELKQISITYGVKISICIAILVGLVLFHFFVERLI